MLSISPNTASKVSLLYSYSLTLCDEYVTSLMRWYFEAMQLSYDKSLTDDSRLTQILLLWLPRGDILIQLFLLQLS